MSKFKVGDRVRALATTELLVPGEYTVYGFHCGDVLVDVIDRLGNPNRLSYPPEWFELVPPTSPSPVRPKTVKEIVRGVYSGVHVCDVDKAGGVWVEIAGQKTASELRDAARIFIELADALADPA